MKNKRYLALLLAVLTAAACLTACVKASAENKAPEPVEDLAPADIPLAKIEHPVEAEIIKRPDAPEDAEAVKIEPNRETVPPPEGTPANVQIDAPKEAPKPEPVCDPVCTDPETCVPCDPNCTDPANCVPCDPNCTDPENCVPCPVDEDAARDELLRAKEPEGAPQTSCGCGIAKETE